MQQREELELLRWRISFVGYAIVVALVTLAFGYWNLQMVQSPYYTDLADKNRIREIPLVAPRGRIYDRNHRIIADNRPSPNIELIRENSPHSVEQTAAILAQGIGMSKEDLLDRIEHRIHEPKFRPIILKEDISVADIAFVEAHQYELPEISVEFQPRRRYLGIEMAAHALGYVGEVTEAQLATAEFQDFRSGDQVGQAGLERAYNAVLRGKDGFRRVVVNTSGREVERLSEEPAIPGNDLYTTLDLDLQKAAEDTIGDRSGAVVVLDPRTGEVLALVSKPAFDPNLFATRISVANYNSLLTDDRKPLRNRAIQNAYSPGSVFKIFMAAAGLEAETLSSLDHVYCNGSAVHYGRVFACDKHDGHGSVDVHEAIVHSCNVFFYEVGQRLGIDRIAKYANMMGLGRKTGIELPNESSGIIPSQEWSQKVRKTAWYPGETISVSIGQGAVNVTPLQAAWAMGGLASGGRLFQPHLVQPEELKKMGFVANAVQSEEYPIHQSTVDIVVSGMWGVVNEGGTATNGQVEGFDVAGKTGTAQVVGKDSGLKGDDFKDNAWFVGFAPYRNPEIVVAAFVEHGGFGHDAAVPVAHAVLATYYNKKTGHVDGAAGPAKVAELK